MGFVGPRPLELNVDLYTAVLPSCTTCPLTVSHIYYDAWLRKIFLNLIAIALLRSSFQQKVSRHVTNRIWHYIHTIQEVHRCQSWRVILKPRLLHPSPKHDPLDSIVTTTLLILHFSSWVLRPSKPICKPPLGKLKDSYTMIRVSNKVTTDGNKSIWSSMPCYFHCCFQN